MLHESTMERATGRTGEDAVRTKGIGRTFRSTDGPFEKGRVQQAKQSQIFARCRPLRHDGNADQRAG